MAQTIENMRIKSTHLGYEDHGIFTYFLTLEGDGVGINFGGYSLDSYDTEFKARFGTSHGMQRIIDVLKTLEVEKWESLPGTYVRAKFNGMVLVTIGHLIKDKWVALT